MQTEHDLANEWDQWLERGDSYRIDRCDGQNVVAEWKDFARYPVTYPENGAWRAIRNPCIR